MPFGLTCAPSVFQRLMDLVLCGLSYDICMVYLDDVIVYSADFDTHLQRLQTVFDRLRAAKLKLKPSKCCLFQRKVAFLGHVVSGEGVEMQAEKLAAVRDWPVPCSLTEVRAFLGLCSYYRRFVSNFAKIAAPLHALTQKGVRFRWADAEQVAFDELKDKLTSAPILGIPQDTGTYILDTDASAIALGAVLTQVQDGQERVISYASRTLNTSEKNYSTTRRELLAVVYGLRQYRQYLLGRPFVIRVDHSALQWLRHTPDPVAQQARWLAFIEQFQYTIVHRSGARHGNADGLSRRPASDSDDAADCVAAVRAASKQQPVNPTLHGLSAAGEDLSLLQLSDPEIGCFVQLRVQREDPPEAVEIAHESEATKVLCSQWYRLTVKDGVVYRILFGRQGEPDRLQLLAPQAIRLDIMRGAHAGMTGGHLGLKRSLDQVQRRAYWLGWRGDMKRFYNGCIDCNRYHRGKPPRTGPLQPVTAGAPFERLSIDLTGPHVRSRRGAIYILTCYDPFTKWAEAFSLPNKEAATVARVLTERVFCRFGVPLALLSDNGKEVDGAIMNELCKLLGVDKMHTTVYKPSTNPVERFHRTLNAMIGKVLDDDQKDWDVVLPYVMAAYRCSRNDVTGYTPNYLVLGREVRGPIDIMLGTSVAGEQPTNCDEFVSETKQRMEYAFDLVRKHLGVAAERNKHYYDLRVRTKPFAVGDKVLYFNPRHQMGKQNKWCKKYTGPFEVVKILGPVNVLLQKDVRSRAFPVHVEKVKLYPNTDNTKSYTAISDASPIRVPRSADQRTKMDNCDFDAEPSRPRRSVRRPRRYED